MAKYTFLIVLTMTEFLFTSDSEVSLFQKEKNITYMKLKKCFHSFDVSISQISVQLQKVKFILASSSRRDLYRYYIVQTMNMEAEGRLQCKL